MGLLLLLTSALLCSHFHPGSVVKAQRSFTIKDIALSIEPSSIVSRDTSVTLRCQANVSSFGLEPLSREYTIYKDGITVYTKNSSSSEDLLYRLSGVRVSNTGKYWCKINIEGKPMTSAARKLTVTGLSKPVLHVNKGVVTEGEETTATCTAHGETGSIFFYFYEDSTEMTPQDRAQVNANQAEVKLSFRTAGIHRIHCAYTVLVTPESFKSEESSAVVVSVKELPVAAVLEILPHSTIYEGDKLSISCTAKNLLPTYEGVHFYLSRGNQLLSRGDTEVNYSSIALAEDIRDFECRLEVGDVVKSDTGRISVTELFSVPTLTVSPAEVFQRENITLTCKSESSASVRLDQEELTYALDPPGSLLVSGGTGIFSGRAPPHNFNYTCVARAKGVEKHSEPLTVRPKVAVSTPKISVEGRAVLGKPFKILCQSDVGSLPINYTLLKGHDPLSTAAVTQPSQPALFTVSVERPDEISKFTCEAKNSGRDAASSRGLDATVIEPLSHPILTVIPHLPEISEEDNLLLICGVRGTPPVTFKWYRVGTEQPLFTTTSSKNNSDYQVHRLSREHSGVYYCEAVNHANNAVRSERVTIEVHLALWKKLVIGGFCLLTLFVLVVVSVLCFRSKRVRLDRATVSVWSERPPEEVNDEESSVASKEPDVEYTEVVHPRPVDPTRVPLKKGTETVYSELQNSPDGAADPHDYGSVQYAELNSEQPEVNNYLREVNNHQDLPVQVD
ncbi:platelet endothelial cell adhesion molecule isoform X2 [Pungitius pungitius]|uniref:platelet endothelial cell adhesion molecule isoform X2 n=1 Tax=Pungitius pungitius TaxID=134920 RepID=UPI002E0F3844